MTPKEQSDRLAAEGIVGPLDDALACAAKLAPDLYRELASSTPQPFEDYRSSAGVNISSLKSMAISPLHYQHAITTPREATDSMALGTLMHAMVFEAETIDARYVVWDGGVRRGKAWEAFQAEHAGKEILRAPEDWERAEGVAAAVLAHPVAAALLAEGKAEESMWWTDKETGLLCKGKRDWTTGTTIVDLKTTRNISPHAIQRQLVALSYHAQSSFYCDGMRALTGREHGFTWIYVEQFPPHDVAVYRLTGDVYRAGRDLYRAWLRRVAECTASGVWPGTAPTEQEMELPAWATDNDDEGEIEI